MNEHVYITYVLSDLGIPFYVGKGKSIDRAYSHEKFAKSGDIADLGFGLKVDYNPHKTRKIKKILSSGREIEYVFYYFSSEYDAFQYEMELIEKYGRTNISENGTLTNISKGGSGGSFFETDEQKKNVINKRVQTVLNKSIEEKNATNLKRKNTLAARTEEQKHETFKKLSNSRKKYWESLSEDQRKLLGQKQRAGRKGTKIGPSPRKGLPATGNNMKGVRKAWNKDLRPSDPRYEQHRQSVINAHRQKNHQWSGRTPFKLIDPHDNVVEGNSLTWLVNTYDLSTRVKNLINNTCSSYKGWIRYDDRELIIPKKTNRKTKGGKPVIIDRYSLDGIYLDTWPTLKAAATNFNFSSGTLSTFIKNGKPFCGFLWKKHVDEL